VPVDGIPRLACGTCLRRHWTLQGSPVRQADPGRLGGHSDLSAGWGQSFELVEIQWSASSSVAKSPT
jgi:hypothetical protein